MPLIKIKYKNGDKDWALLDEREFVVGVHERYVEPGPVEVNVKVAAPNVDADSPAEAVTKEMVMEQIEQSVRRRKPRKG